MLESERPIILFFIFEIRIDKEICYVVNKYYLAILNFVFPV